MPEATHEPPAFAPLTAALIRRAASLASPSGDAPRRPSARGREDLRLFFFAWAAGFVFFLAFLA